MRCDTILPLALGAAMRCDAILSHPGGDAMRRLAFVGDGNGGR